MNQHPKYKRIQIIGSRDFQSTTLTPSSTKRLDSPYLGDVTSQDGTSTFKLEATFIVMAKVRVGRPLHMLILVFSNNTPSRGLLLQVGAPSLP
jgi:hypothetical protein